MVRQVQGCMIVLVLLVSTNSFARMPEYAPPAGMPVEPGYHTHDGFFLRFTPGISYAMGSETYQGDTLKLSGGGIGGSFAIGGAVAPNFILCGELTAISMLSPAVSVNGQSLPVRSDASVGFQYFGVGASYYLPENFFLHLGVGGVYVASSNSSGSASSDSGLGVKLMVGKEWWVSTDWGLGFAAHAVLASIPEKAPSTASMFTSIFGLGFSATYN